MATGFSTFKSGVKLGTGQKLGFTAGKGYYARGAAPAAAAGGGAGADPFGLLTPGQIANQIAGYTAKLPAPMTGPQIQQQASDELSPIVASLTSQFQNATKAGTDSIAGYSKTLADQLATEIGNVQATYGGAEQAQAAADAAEAQGVKDTGTGLAANLAGKFASMGAGADASNVGLSPVTAGATGAGNALLGHGSAALSALIGEGAAQGAYTAKLPGIAGQQGLQDIANLTASNQKNLADATTQVESRLPDIVNALTSRSDTNATNRVQMSRQIYNDLVGQNVSRAAAKAAVQKLGLPDPTLSRAYGYAVDSAGNPVGGKVQPLPGFHSTQSGGVAKDVKPPSKNAPKGPKVDSTLSKTYGYLVDTSGTPILRNGQKVPLPKSGSTVTPKPSASLSRIYGYIVDQFGNAILKNGKKTPVKSSSSSNPFETTPTVPGG